MLQRTPLNGSSSFRNVSGPSPFVLENSIQPSVAACISGTHWISFPELGLQILVTVLRRNVFIVSEVLPNSFSFLVHILCLGTLSELILSYLSQLSLYSVYLWTLEFSRHFLFSLYVRVCACMRVCAQSYIDGILQFSAFPKTHVMLLLQHVEAH
jgi:hypothetical protein